MVLVAFDAGPDVVGGPQEAGSDVVQDCRFGGAEADGTQDQFWFTMYSAGKGWTLDSFGRRPMDEREA